LEVYNHKLERERILAKIRQRRHRATERDRVVSKKSKEVRSRYQQKGLLLTGCFHLAWVRFSYTDKFRELFPRARFRSFQEDDAGMENSPLVDFEILARTPDNSVFLVPVEVKNWFAPQVLDIERFLEKIGNKFMLYAASKKVADILIPHLGDRFVKLLVLTDAVQFADEVREILSGYRVERVDKLPFPQPEGLAVYEKDGVPASVWEALEARIVEQMVAILKRVFYGA
jgi:hypothetical protein